LRALESVPEPFRQALLLVDLGELPYKDAAEELSVPIGTIMSRLHRARRLLREALAVDLAA
jgi:RNA polymerase sigma-70 factor (ECF subfamily)